MKEVEVVLLAVECGQHGKPQADKLNLDEKTMPPLRCQTTCKP